MVTKVKQTSDILQKNQIVVARVSDSLTSPQILCLVDYPNYQAHLNDVRVLNGIDEVELRVIDFDNERKTVKLSFHASSILNPNVSTGRAILLTYTSMRNTVTQVFRNLFS